MKELNFQENSTLLGYLETNMETLKNTILGETCLRRLFSRCESSEYIHPSYKSGNLQGRFSLIIYFKN